jgi:hypothetical protein
VRLRTRLGGVAAVEGRFRALALEASSGRLRLTLPESPAAVRVTLASGRVVPVEGTGPVEVSLAAPGERVGASSP